jgi:hypothetical protein
LYECYRSDRKYKIVVFCNLQFALSGNALLQTNNEERSR